MSQHELEILEVNIDQAKAAIERRDALLRLEQNPDYRLVIGDDYMQNEPARLARLKVDPSMQSELHQKNVDHQIAGIGSLYRYITTVKQVGQMAEESLPEYEETRVELMEEEIQEGNK